MQRSTLALLCFTSFTTSALQAQESDADKRFTAIAKRYHRVVARRPRKGTAFDLLYRHYLDAGRLEELVKHYQTQTKDDAKDAASQMVLGMVYERRGRLQDALKHVQLAVKAEPKSFYPKYAAALLMVRQYQRREAIGMLQKAIEDKPDRNMLMDIYKRLGRLQLAEGKKKEALTAWSKLLEVFPNNVRVLQELAELLSVEEQFDEAIKRYQRGRLRPRC